MMLAHFPSQMIRDFMLVTSERKLGGTNPECKLLKLPTVVVYPRTETAMISATNGKRVFTLMLVRVRRSGPGTTFRMRL